jgi:integron cassette protein
MSRTVVQVDALQEYLLGVLDRAGHHAGNVREAILTVAGAVVLFKDPSYPIEARTYGGSTANMLWVYFSGVRYTLRYEHHNQAIELREQNNQGRLVASIDNTTPTSQIIELFQSL